MIVVVINADSMALGIVDIVAATAAAINPDGAALARSTDATSTAPSVTALPPLAYLLLLLLRLLLVLTVIVGPRERV